MVLHMLKTLTVSIKGNLLLSWQTQVDQLECANRKTPILPPQLIVALGLYM